MMKNRNKFLISTLLISIFLLITLNLFIVTPYYISGRSMESTLQKGDVILSLNIDLLKKLQIMKIEEPIYLKNRLIIINDKEKLIKRCVGIPGDTLIFNIKNYNDTIIVPDGKIFAIGDNINASYDSKQNGCYSINNIESIPFYVYFSYNNSFRINRLGFLR